MNWIMSVLLIVFMVLSSVVLFGGAFAVWLVTFPFDRRRVILHRYSCFWAAIYTWIMPLWSVKISGRKKINSKKTYVMVSNHQSNLDILVLFRLFAHFKWVSKIEIFKMPLIGWNMYLNRYIGLRRGDKSSIEKMMDDCRKTLRSGSSIFMFPEGTRSVDGNLRPFKAGAFILAHELHLPILPVVINGACNALPKNSLIITGKSNIRVNILDEIPYEKFKHMTANETADMVRSLIASHVVLQ